MQLLCTADVGDLLHMSPRRPASSSQQNCTFCTPIFYLFSSCKRKAKKTMLKYKYLMIRSHSGRDTTTPPYAPKAPPFSTPNPRAAIWNASTGPLPLQLQIGGTRVAPLVPFACMNLTVFSMMVIKGFNAASFLSNPISAFPHHPFLFGA
ncbi:hypothetical protein M758_10G133800 [Ceratodon purpureus]|uniref:Uncharacterized protein n=1 Tax=Ceratodon purpureus TaxID=3225 RepID=A0A8T0GK82_CERPU|nr:hypothetical protein KC19_10G138500 [Ceratodon purpureus]KAG0603958.1 hypothetical protein M758_10G133800 [Ceratodon purpureus]